MRLANKKLDELDEQDLRQLLNAQQAHGKALDYERDLPGNADGDRREFPHFRDIFRSPVRSRAIIYGIEDTGGLPVAVDGVAADGDAAIPRFDSMVQPGIHPRISGLAFKSITPGTGMVVVVARIPQSAAPHTVTCPGSHQFRSRNSAGGVVKLSADRLSPGC